MGFPDFLSFNCSTVDQFDWTVQASTGWFIINGTVQNTDLSADVDVLDKIFCIQ